MQNKQRKELSIAQDTFWTLTFSHVVFLGVMLLIYFGVFFVLVPYFEGGVRTTPDFLTFSQSAANIYILIMGIIGAYYYFPMYVEFGVTRKKTFMGSVLGLIAGSISLVVLAVIISGILQLIFSGLGMNIAWDTTLFNNFIDSGEAMINQGRSVLAQNTFLAGVGRLGITMISYTVFLMLFYTIGWMIGTTFYRSGVFKGVGSILLALFIIMIGAALWGDGILPRISLGAGIMSQWFLAVVGTIILIALLLWMIRALTKRITIKLT